jgi:hypothetical protein
MVERFRRGRVVVALRGGAIAVLLCLVAAQCSKSPTNPSPGGSDPNVPNTPTVPGPAPAVSQIFSGAGDIAICDTPQNAAVAEATASLLDTIGGMVFTLGDNAYPSGTAADFECYDRSWGRHKGRTFPSPGNHDYHDYKAPGADAYFRYFGSAAGPAGLGYYSFDLGAWHIISLNSNSDDPSVQVSAGSAQAAWLRQDLAAHPAKCTLAYWHHPLFSSGPNENPLKMRDFYRILYDAGADVVLNGHDHLYERFLPQDADGRGDAARGIAQFVVGTGGKELYEFRGRRPNSAAQVREHGILKLTLNPESYNFEFISTGGGARDFGANVACH